MMTTVYFFLGFAVSFLIGHWYVNIRKNSYENIFGLMLLVGLAGTIIAGIIAFVEAIFWAIHALNFW